ncbi:hypothetical protein GPALN_012069 [Globodera pallida]|nr:hypothetical protein GPALN_012069 [Globodera pallida]
MGSSSSSSDDGAGWTPVSPCGCGCQHYRAVKMEWQTHPMSTENQILINTGKTLLAPLTFGASFWGTADTAHHAVLVYFVCAKCGNENRRTYDLSSDGKESRLNGCACDDWARDFFRLVDEKSKEKEAAERACLYIGQAIAVVLRLLVVPMYVPSRK